MTGENHVDAIGARGAVHLHNIGSKVQWLDVIVPGVPRSSDEDARQKFSLNISGCPFAYGRKGVVVTCFMLSMLHTTSTNFQTN